MDIVSTLRRLEARQGEDYIWRTAKAAADEIEYLRASLTTFYTAISRGGYLSKEDMSAACKALNIPEDF